MPVLARLMRADGSPAPADFKPLRCNYVAWYPREYVMKAKFDAMASCAVGGLHSAWRGTRGGEWHERVDQFNLIYMMGGESLLSFCTWAWAGRPVCRWGRGRLRGTSRDRPRPTAATNASPESDRPLRGAVNLRLNAKSTL
jgi:hypothetical protein